MKNSALRFILCAAVAMILSLNALAQTELGQIKAARLEGEVLRELKDGTHVALKDGEILIETDVVITGKSSSVVLVFMNGSTVKLGPESRLGIDVFRMDPFADDVKEMKMSAMKEEPTKSKTALNLSYGEMVGDVKKLNPSSSYSIKTPVGAAGIRGTIFRIVFRPDPSGKAFFTVSTAEGRVVMQGVSTVDIPIVEGKEVVVEIDVPAAPATPGGTPAPATPDIKTQDIPAATKELIASEAQSIAVVIELTTFVPADTKAAEEKKAAEDKAAAEKAAEEKAAAEKKAAEEKAAAEKAAEEKAAADKAAADKAAADKAAADKAAADKAATDKAAADKAAADQAAANQATADKKGSTEPPLPQPVLPTLTQGAGS